MSHLPVQPQDHLRSALRDLLIRIRRLETRAAPSSLPSGVRIGDAVFTTSRDRETGILNVQITDATTGGDATVNGS